MSIAHFFLKENIARHILMFQRNQLLIWLQWACGNETKKKWNLKRFIEGFFSCNTFLLVEDDVIEIANFLWVLMVNDRYVCGIVVSWENLSGVVSLCGWMLIGCLFIDGTTALMLDVVIETALTMVAVVLPLTGIYKNNTKLSTGLAMYYNVNPNDDESVKKIWRGEWRRIGITDLAWWIGIRDLARWMITNRYNRFGSVNDHESV